MNYEDEQKNELEALGEIYYNEINGKLSTLYRNDLFSFSLFKLLIKLYTLPSVISNKQPISFSIRIRPQASYLEEAVPDQDDGSDQDSDAEIDSEESKDLFVNLRFEFPSKYPDEKPFIKVIDSNDLEDDELSELMEMLSAKSEESLGTVMTFMLVSDVVEWLSTKSERDAMQKEQELLDKQREREAEEARKIDGTPVTKQTFMAWKAKFDAEMLKIKLDQMKRADQGGPTGTKRLSGREMFESDKTLIESDLNFVEDLDQEQIEALLQDVDGLDLDDDEEGSEFDPSDTDTENSEESDNDDT